MDTTESTTTRPLRRRFLDRLLALWTGGFAASVLYPIARFVVPPVVPEAATLSVSAGPADSLAPNSARIVPFGNAPLLVLKTDNGDIRAFSATCTHLACTVQYRNDQRDIWCACHNGLYDLNGRNVAGPPPLPLTPFDVAVRDGEIMISRRA